jgi:LysR family transcriptional regulator, regulator for bpeEF and oprC
VKDQRSRIPLSRRFDAIPVAAFRSFVAVVEAGGFSAASRQLGLAVSTVSKHVDMLEARLRTSLVLRTTRRVTITEAGTEFYEQCRVMLDRLDEVAEANFAPNELRGHLRVVAPPSFTSCILAPALPHFLSRHPNLRVDLRVTTAEVDFLRDGIDLAVRMTDASTGSDRLERIGPAPSILCASPDYLARFGTPRRPEDLKAHRCFSGISSPYGERWQFRIGQDTVFVPIRSVFASDTGDVLRAACLDGLGIGGFYEFHVRRDLEAGRLVRVLGEFQADVSSLCVALPGERYTPSKTSAFLSFLIELWQEKGTAGLASEQPPPDRAS